MSDENRQYAVTLEHDMKRNPPCYYVPSDVTYEMVEGKYLEVTLGGSFPKVVDGYEDPSTWITWEGGKVTKPTPDYSVLETINIYENANGSPGQRLGGSTRLAVPWDPRISMLLPQWWDFNVMKGGKAIYKLSILSSDARVCRIWDLDVSGQDGPDDIYHFGLQVSMGGTLYGSDPEMHNTGGGDRKRQLIGGLMGQLGQAAR